MLDDISSALDVETEIQLWDRINQYRQSRNVTCLVVTQKKHALKLADHIIVLEAGSIKAQGTLHELMDDQQCEEISSIFKK